jgi:hypothetical protein
LTLTLTLTATATATGGNKTFRAVDGSGC